MTLGELKWIRNEIGRLKYKLERIESEAYSVTPKLSGMPPSSSGVSDKVGNAAALITDLKIDIQALEMKYSMAINLLNLEKFEENCIYLRLARNYKWARIAAISGMTEDAVKKMCYRYQW